VKDATRIDAGQDHHKLTGGPVRDVDEGMSRASGHANQLSRGRFKPLAIYLEQILAFEHSKHFSLAVAMERRTKSQGIARLYNSESLSRHARRQLHDKLETKCRNGQCGGSIGRRTKKLEVALS